MKKLLVVLLALVLGAGLLFAADAKWGAWAEGDIILWNQDGQVGWGPAWGQAPAYWYNTTTLSYGEDKFGFSGTLLFGGDAFNSAFRNVKAWYKPVDMLTLSFGKLREAAYNPASFVEGSFVYGRIANGGTDWGLLAQVAPVKGASLGVLVVVPPAFADADYANNLAFGASYDIENLAKISAQYKLTTDELGFSVNVNAIKGLPVLVQYGLTTGTTMTHKVLLSTSYGMDKISLALDAALKYDTAAVFAVEALASYKLSDMYTVGANLAYDTGYGWTTDFSTGFGVFPWVTVNCGGGSITTGFRLSTGGFGTDVLSWNIPIKFVVAF